MDDALLAVVNVLLFACFGALIFNVPWLVACGVAWSAGIGLVSAAWD